MPSTKSDQSRIFLVGCPRSGTSVIQRKIAEHPKIATAPESQFFKSLYRSRMYREGGTVPLSNRTRVVVTLQEILLWLGFTTREVQKKLHNFLTTISYSGSKSAFKSRRVSYLVELLDEGLCNLAMSCNASCWLEKSPDHLHYIREITSFFPDAKFIHVVRNPTNTVASLYDAAKSYPREHWGRRYGDIRRCCERWNCCTRESTRLIGNKSHFIIKFSDFVADTDTALGKLDTFLELDTDDRKKHPTKNPRVTHSNELWKSAVHSEIKKPVDKFAALFSKQERTQIEEATRAAFSSFNDALEQKNAHR